eukprot:Nk52_evm102s352 gene=Nk52_evmTU102s352
MDDGSEESPAHIGEGEEGLEAESLDTVGDFNKRQEKKKHHQKNKKRRKSHRKLEQVKYKRRESADSVEQLTGCVFEGAHDDYSREGKDDNGKKAKRGIIDEMLHRLEDSSASENELVTESAKLSKQEQFNELLEKREDICTSEDKNIIQNNGDQYNGSDFEDDEGNNTVEIVDDAVLDRMGIDTQEDKGAQCKTGGKSLNSSRISKGGKQKGKDKEDDNHVGVLKDSLLNLKKADKFSEDYTSIRVEASVNKRDSGFILDNNNEGSFASQPDILTGFTSNDALDYAVNYCSKDHIEGSSELHSLFHQILFRVFALTQFIFGMTIGLVFLVPNMIQCESFHLPLSEAGGSPVELISNTQKLLIPLFFFIGYGIGLYALGVLADRYGRSRMVIIISLLPAMFAVLACSTTLSTSSNSRHSLSFSVLLVSFFLIGFAMSGHHVIGNLFEEFLPQRNCINGYRKLSMKQKHILFALNMMTFGGATEVLLTFLATSREWPWETIVLVTVSTHILLLLVIYAFEIWVSYKYHSNFKTNLTSFIDKSQDEENPDGKRFTPISFPWYLKFFCLYFESPLAESPLFLLICNKVELAEKILKEAVKMTAINQVVFSSSRERNTRYIDAGAGESIPSSYSILESQLVNTQHVMCQSEDFDQYKSFQSLFSKNHPRGSFLSLIRGLISFDSYSSSFDSRTEKNLRSLVRRKCAFNIIFGAIVVFNFVSISVLSTQYYTSKAVRDGEELSTDGIFCEESSGRLAWNVDTRTFFYMGTAATIQIMGNGLLSLYINIIGPSRGCSFMLLLGSLALFGLYGLEELNKSNSRAALCVVYLSSMFTFSAFTLWWAMLYNMQFPGHVRISGFGFTAGIAILIGSISGLLNSKLIFKDSDFSSSK